MIRKNICRWHRTLSIVCLIPVLLWASSGLVHQFNKWVRPQHIKTSFLNAKLLSDETGYARYIAEKGMKESYVIKEIRIIPEFTNDYPKSQKILPVYGVYYADSGNSVAYIDIRSARIVRTGNDSSRAVHKWFGYLHAYKFIDDVITRNLLLWLASFITLLTAFSGIYVHIIMKPLTTTRNKTTTRYLHRVLGVMSVLFLVTFSFSGIVHVTAGMIPGMEGADRAFFSNIHMLKFTDGIGPGFRFWLLCALAGLHVMLALSGMILTIYFAKRKIAAKVKKNTIPLKTSFSFNRFA